MNRDQLLERLERERSWDFVVIGGGATGLGIAVDAASRGFRVALLEQADFTKSTSSKSTKLVHGGVRYLAQGDVRLVLEALKERGLMRRNAPHLVRDQSFVIPCYRWWEAPFYGIGLTLYDLMAGRLSFGRSRYLSRKRALEAVPALSADKLRGGILYHDGQFDDSRMAVNLAQTAVGSMRKPLSMRRAFSSIRSFRWTTRPAFIWCVPVRESIWCSTESSFVANRP